jgi:hypothetical protein
VRQRNPPLTRVGSGEYAADIMRKTVAVAIVAGTLGFCLASVTAFGAARLNIWRTYGEHFQLGYVIGYLDAVLLAQRKDPRASLTVQGGKDFSRWVKGVNEYFQDPANANRAVPDAMAFVGGKIREEWLRNYAERSRQAGPSPSASPGS